MSRPKPDQKPGKSEQAVGTPRELIDAVERRFGPIKLDLAANAGNCIVPQYIGPGSDIAEDALALTTEWYKFSGNLWLNPPFDDIAPWAAKCKEEGRKNARILFLVPYTVADWFCNHVKGHALVLGLSPRVRFVGWRHAYPKDLMLAVFGPQIAPGWDTWRWKP